MQIKTGLNDIHITFLTNKPRNHVIVNYVLKQICKLKLFVLHQVPLDKEITVQQLQRTGGFVEDKRTNTFAVNFTWKPPSFQYRDVLYYNLSYEFSGYPRNQFPCSSLVKGLRCTITGVVSGTENKESFHNQNHK